MKKLTMSNEDLLEERALAEREYNAEINKNGGHDGTTLALILKSRLQMLKDLQEKYYNK